MCDELLARDHRRGVGGRGGTGRRQPRPLQARTRAAQGVPLLPRPAHHLRVSQTKFSSSSAAVPAGRELVVRRNAEKTIFVALDVPASFFGS